MMDTVYVIIGFALGGVLKGAIGAGAPIIAVPILALLYDVPLAVAIFVMPNLLSNLWQGWAYRSHQLPPAFVLQFAGAGAIGAGLGTLMLANFSDTALKLMVALSVFGYIAFRLLKPEWILSYSRGLRLAWPMGALAGMLQGASGVSAPVSITFLNAMRPERNQFISTIAVFFTAMTLVQIPMLVSFGFLTLERFWLSCAALIPLVAFMPLGSFLAERFSRDVFDRAVLVLLAVLAVRLVFEAWV